MSETTTAGAAGAATEAAPRSVFWVPDFRFVLVGRVVSTAASAVTWVLLPLYVYDTTGSASATGLMSAMNVVPFLLFGLFVGAVVDRLPARTVMGVVEVVNAGVVLLVPLAIVTVGVPLPVLLVVGFLSSTAFVWFDVASSALVPAIAGSERVFQANGHLWTATTIVNAFAAPVGYLLLDRLGLGGTFAVLAGAYVLSAVVVLLVQTGRSRSAGPPVSRRIGREELTEGLRFIRSDKVIWVLTLVGFGVGLSGGAVYTMIVVLADTSLGLVPDDTRVAWIMAAGSVGAIGAAVVAPRLRRRDPLVVSLVVLMCDVLLMVAYAWSPTWVAAAVLVACWNLVHTVAMIVSISVRQQRCPPELQGRVNAVGRMLAWGAVPLGGGICGVLVDLTGNASASITAMALPVTLAVVLLATTVTARMRATTPEGVHQ